MKQYLFKPNLHVALWGTESWEISAFPSSPSVISGGECDGKTLSSVHPDFPLLFKVIDAKTRLSVQVHPNEKTRLATGGDPKTEMWCALTDGPIYAGLCEGVEPEDVEEAVRSGKFEEVLVRHDAKAGDVFYIPGGLVHAIGDGVKLYEVQQSSNTTFRLYDWGRTGADGKPRELHIEKGLQAADCSLLPPIPCRELKTPFFDFAQREVDGECVFGADPGKFLALFAAKGDVLVDGTPLKEGASMLLESASEVRISGEGAKIFLTAFGAKS